MEEVFDKKKLTTHPLLSLSPSVLAHSDELHRVVHLRAPSLSALVAEERVIDDLEKAMVYPRLAISQS